MEVFVSATSADLARFRQAVATEVLQHEARPVVQDYFGIDHRQLPALLKTKISKCDAVICLVGSTFGAAPPGSNRSYTQMEYDFAEQFQKPTFLFFYSQPSPPSETDPSTNRNVDTPEQRELQAKYIAQLRSNTKVYYDFANETEVRLYAARVLSAISPEAAGTKIAQTIKTDYPAPMSVVYDSWFGNNESRVLRLLVRESLRFICLLAMQDSVVHRIFGCESADMKERVQTLARDKVQARDWRSLLHLACPNEATRGVARFITEFAGWERRNSELLDRLLKCEADLEDLDAYDTQSQTLTDLRLALTSILGELEFFTRYVLLVVTEVDPHTGSCTARILRGLADRSFQFNTNPQSAIHPETNQLYLLSLHRRRALCLTPSLTYRRTDAGQERVYGWAGSRRPSAAGSQQSSAFLTRHTPFDAQNAAPISEGVDTLSDWLGEELCQLFGCSAPTREVVWEGRLLDNDSWKNLQEAVFPPGAAPEVVGGRFRLAGAPIYRGFHADLFEAEDMEAIDQRKDPGLNGVTAAANSVVHVLRIESAADEDIRAWFRNRAECWQQLEHPGIVRLHESDPPTWETGLPFLVADSVPSARSLEQVMQSGEPLPEPVVLQAIELAAEICRLAHQQGVFLLSLPPRHFLMSGGERLLVTGFEAATRARDGEEFAPDLLRRVSRFTKDLDLIAPELRRDSGRFAPTLDVFAIGRLIARLRKLPPEAMDLLPIEDWDDPWRCLTYHCLAADPNKRFQSPDHVLTFLKEWFPCKEPHTVRVDAVANERGFSIGKYPVTNEEYTRFTREVGYLSPPHLRGRGRQLEEPDDDEARRLNGPWLPITYVSLSDAEAYCEWLTKQTDKLWRLPTEKEWLRAARYETARLYPWGDDVPDRTRSNYGAYYRGPTVVGAFPGGRSYANSWDMSGNVWEWCTDMVRTGAPRRILKGGAYDYSADALQLASGDARVVTCRSPHVGFRVLCEEAQ